jgi:hypothetical protein
MLLLLSLDTPIIQIMNQLTPMEMLAQVILNVVALIFLIGLSFAISDA